MAITYESMIGDALQRRYRNLIVQTVYLKTVLLDLIQKNKPQPFGEDGLRHLVTLSPSANVGARDAGEKLPRSYPATRRQSIIQRRRLYASVAFDNAIKWNFKKGESSYVTEIDQSIKDCVEITTWHMNRMAHGDGTGRLAIVDGAQVDAGSVLNPLLLKHAYGYTYGATQFCMENSLVVFGQIVGGVLINATPRRIVSRDWTGQTVVLDAVITLPDNSVMVLGDDQGHSYNKEYQGTQSLFGAAGVFQNINASDFARWRSYTRAINGAYDWNDVLSLIGAVRRTDADVSDLVLVWHEVQTRNHQRANEDNVLFEPRDFTFSRGTDVPIFQYMGKKIPIRETLWAPYERIECFSRAAIGHFPNKELDWNKDGGGIVKPLQGTDMSYAFMTGYGNFGLNTRKTTGWIDGVRIDRALLDSLMERA